jgi:hypothetical protein
MLGRAAPDRDRAAVSDRRRVPGVLGPDRDTLSPGGTATQDSVTPAPAPAGARRLHGLDRTRPRLGPGSGFKFTEWSVIMIISG